MRRLSPSCGQNTEMVLRACELYCVEDVGLLQLVCFGVEIIENGAQISGLQPSGSVLPHIASGVEVGRLPGWLNLVTLSPLRVIFLALLSSRWRLHP